MSRTYLRLFAYIGISVGLFSKIFSADIFPPVLFFDNSPISLIFLAQIITSHNPVFWGRLLISFLGILIFFILHEKSKGFTAFSQLVGLLASDLLVCMLVIILLPAILANPDPVPFFAGAHALFWWVLITFFSVVISRSASFLPSSSLSFLESFKILSKARLRFVLGMFILALLLYVNYLLFFRGPVTPLCSERELFYPLITVVIYYME